MNPEQLATVKTWLEQEFSDLTVEQEAEPLNVAKFKVGDGRRARYRLAVSDEFSPRTKALTQSGRSSPSGKLARCCANGRVSRCCFRAKAGSNRGRVSEWHQGAWQKRGKTTCREQVTTDHLTRPICSG